MLLIRPHGIFTPMTWRNLRPSKPSTYRINMPMTINVSLPTLVLSVALSVPTTLIINHLVNPPPRFAVFDLKGTVQTYSKDLAEQGLDDSTLTLKTRQFSMMLDTVLTRYSHQNKVILLVEPAVIKGAPNVTQPLQKEVSLALSRLPS
ncbi:hypothetical protein GLP14_15235 [Photobacterium carnosum]|nr:hypothetical protein [Photobacterium carnosum]